GRRKRPDPRAGWRSPTGPPTVRVGQVGVLAPSEISQPGPQRRFPLQFQRPDEHVKRGPATPSPQWVPRAGAAIITPAASTARAHGDSEFEPGARRGGPVSPVPGKRRPAGDRAPLLPVLLPPAGQRLPGRRDGALPRLRPADAPAG